MSSPTVSRGAELFPFGGEEDGDAEVVEVRIAELQLFAQRQDSQRLDARNSSSRTIR